MTVSEALELFLVDQELKGNTEKTIHDYRQFIGYFVDYIGKEVNVADIVLGNVRQYHLYLKNTPAYKSHKYRPLKEKKISKTTIQTYLKALRTFFIWLYNEGYMTENITEKLIIPKAPKKVIEILSDEEIEIVLKAIKSNTEFGVRNLCMVSLMLDSGLRLNEVLELNYDNIHMTQGVAKVFGKGQKERIVPLGLYTKKMLMKYMNGYRSLPEYPTKRLFIDQEKKPITMNAVKMFFERLRKKTKIDRLHAHMLRHTFATRYLMNGGDVFTLQQILGHTSLEMVRRYSHIASSYVTSNFKRLSPIDNILVKKHGF